MFAGRTDRDSRLKKSSCLFTRTSRKLFIFVVSFLYDESLFFPKSTFWGFGSKQRNPKNAKEDAPIASCFEIAFSLESGKLLFSVLKIIAAIQTHKKRSTLEEVRTCLKPGLSIP